MAAKHFLCVQRNASAEMLNFHALLFAIVVECVTADALNNFWIFFISLYVVQIYLFSWISEGGFIKVF